VPAAEGMTTVRRALLAAFVLGLGFSITLAQAALTLLTVLWLGRLCWRETREAVRWPLWRPVLAFSAVSVLSALLTAHPAEALVSSKKLLLVAALYVSVDELDSAERAERFLSVLALAVAGAAALVLLQVSLCPGPEADYGFPAWLYHRCARARGFFSSYMTLAGVLNLTLLVSLPRLLLGTTFRPWRAIAWIASLGGLAATYTRGAWIGFASGVLALWPLIRKRNWLLVVGLLTLGLAVLVGPQQLRERVLTMTNPDDVTVKERTYMWRSGIAMWQEHPWLGVGPGGVKREYRHYALAEALMTRTGHLHNSALQILVETGVAGLLAWLWLWAAFFMESVRLLRRLPAAATRERALVAGSIAAVTGFLVAGAAEHNFGDSEVVMLAWMIIALPYVVARAAPLALARSAPS
jgi:putative inorganic carbon (hco3(-)) transporter